MVEIDEGVVWPKLLAQLVSSNQLTGVVQQNEKNLERLLLEPDTYPVPAQFRQVTINFKDTEASDPGGLDNRIYLNCFHRHDQGYWKRTDSALSLPKNHIFGRRPATNDAPPEDRRTSGLACWTHFPFIKLLMEATKSINSF
jgi:hypothetical protein